MAPLMRGLIFNSCILFRRSGSTPEGRIALCIGRSGSCNRSADEGTHSVRSRPVHRSVFARSPCSAGRPGHRESLLSTSDFPFCSARLWSYSKGGCGVGQKLAGLTIKIWKYALVAGGINIYPLVYPLGTLPPMKMKECKKLNTRVTRK